MKRIGNILAFSLLATVGSTAPQLAHSAMDLGDTDGVTAHGGRGLPDGISADFASFAGSPANAKSLVAGLRNGQPITLTAPASSGQPASSVTFTAPTKPMGEGNVFLSLALAKQQLAAQGITAPTPQQLEASLMGGTITAGNPPRTVTLSGVAQLRSQGMGWGKIAQAQGTKLGDVVAGMKSAAPKHASGRSGREIEKSEHEAIGEEKAERARSPRTTAGGAAATRFHLREHETGRGIVSAAGAPVGVRARSERATGSEERAEHARAIRTAAGGAAIGISISQVRAHDSGGAVVSATGAPVGVHGIAQATVRPADEFRSSGIVSADGGQWSASARGHGR